MGAPSPAPRRGRSRLVLEEEAGTRRPPYRKGMTDVTVKPSPGGVPSHSSPPAPGATAPYAHGAPPATSAVTLQGLYKAYGQTLAVNNLWLEIPAGTHKIEFRCVDDVYLRSARISLIASIVVGVVFLALLGMAVRSAVVRKA